MTIKFYFYSYGLTGRVFPLAATLLSTDGRVMPGIPLWAFQFIFLRGAGQYFSLREARHIVGNRFVFS